MENKKEFNHNNIFKDKEFTPKQARHYKGISTKTISSALGLSEKTYINKENGSSKFFVDEAVTFSEFVGIPFRYIDFFSKVI